MASFKVTRFVTCRNGTVVETNDDCLVRFLELSYSWSFDQWDIFKNRFVKECEARWPDEEREVWNFGVWAMNRSKLLLLFAERYDLSLRWGVGEQRVFRCVPTKSGKTKDKTHHPHVEASGESLGALDLSRCPNLMDKDECDVWNCPYCPEKMEVEEPELVHEVYRCFCEDMEVDQLVAQGNDFIAKKVGNTIYIPVRDESSVVSLPMTPSDWKLIFNVRDYPFMRMKLEDYLSDGLLDRMNRYAESRTSYKAGTVEFWFNLLLGSRRVRENFMRFMEAPIVAQGGERLDVTVLRVLSDGVAHSALEIAKKCGLKHKRDVNPTLYALFKQGQVEMNDSMRPPMWRRSLWCQGDDTPLESVTNVTTEANLTFIDERPSDFDSTHTGGEIVAKDPHADMAETPWNMNNVLTREIVLGQVTWNAASKIVLKDFPIPKCFSDKRASMIRNQMRIFAYGRFGIEIHAQMNGTKFHQGKVMVVAVPLMWAEDESFYSFKNYSCFPHFFLDPAVSNSGRLLVPFTHLLSHFPLQKGLLENDSICSLGRIRVIVWNPLRMGEGASSNIFITMYGKLVNPEMHQIAVPVEEFSFSDGLVTQGADEGFFKTLLTRTLPGVVGSFLNGMTGGLATGIGSALKGLIFDKPLSPLPPEPLVNRAVDPLCHGAGIDHSTRLALCPISETVTTETTLGGSTGDFNLRTLLEVPTLLRRFEWDDTYGEGALLASWPVCPTYIPKDRLDISSTSITTYDPTMLAYVSVTQVLWRGTITYKCQLAKTAWQSGRLVFIYDPSTCNSYPLRSLDEMMNLNMLVVDIQEKDEWMFEVPFMSVKPWLRCDAFRSDGNYTEVGAPEPMATTTNGRVYVYILNKLVAPENVAKIIDLNVYVAGGKDFELGVPRPVWPLSLTRPSDNPGGYGELEDYPFVVGKPRFPACFDNKDYITSVYFEGRKLYAYKKVFLPNEQSKWWEAIRTVGLGDDEETITWLYKVSILKLYLDGELGPQARLMYSFPSFKESYPLVSQGAEVYTTTRDSEVPSICITKGHRMREIAPTTISENAMNLQTIMRRYYPMMCSVPLYACSGFVVLKVPVSPTRWYKQVAGIGNLSEPMPSNILSWMCRLFTYWRGSLRYKLVMSNTNADVYCWHVPNSCDGFGICTGVKEVEIMANLSYAGHCTVTHLQGALEVEVPFYSAYNQLLIDVHGNVNDLKTQNGTLYFAIRVKGAVDWRNLEAFNFSLFLSTGEDFVLNIIRPPPKVFEPTKVFSDCAGKEKIKVTAVELAKDTGDDCKRVILPGSTGLKAITLQGEFGQCVVEPESGIVAQGRFDDWMPQSVKDTHARLDRVLDGMENLVDRKLDRIITGVESLVENADGALLNVVADDRISKIVGMAENTFEKVTKVVDDPQKTVLDPLNSVFKQTLTKYAVVTAEVLACAGVIFSIKRVLDEPTSSNLVALALSVAGAVGLAVSSSVHNFIGGIVGWLVDLKFGPVQTQALDGPAADFIDTNTNTIVSVVAILGTIFYAYVFGILPPMSKIKNAIKAFFEDEAVIETQAKETGIDLGACMRNSHFSVLGLTAIQKVFDKICDLVKRLLDWLIDRENPAVVTARVTAEHQDKILRLVKEIDDLDYEPNFIAAMTDPLVHNRFYNLMQDISDLTAASIKEKMEPKVVALLTECRRRTQAMIKRYEKDCEIPTRRYDPFIICLHGATRTGKTYLMRRLAKVVAEEMDLSEYNLMYSKNMSDKFWSGYKNQPIVLWDEFGQDRKNSPDYIPQFMTLRGSVPVLLNMSESAEKGRPFTSQCIIMTTNVPYIDYNEIRCNDAFKMRRNLMIGVQHRAGHDAASTQNAKWDQFPNWEHAVFAITDPMREEILEADLDLLKVETKIREEVRKWHANRMGELAGFYGQDMPRGVVAYTVKPGDPEYRDAVAQQDPRPDPAPVPIEDAARQFMPHVPDEYFDALEGEELLGAVGGVAAQGTDEKPNYDLVFCKVDPSAHLTEEERFEAEFFLARCNSVHKHTKNRWITAKEAVLNGGRKLYGLACQALEWCKKTWYKFYEDHPKLATALGLLSLLAGVGLALAMGYDAGGPPKDVESGPYNPGAGVKSARVRMAEAVYSPDGAGVKSQRVRLSQGCEDPVANDIKNVVHNYVYNLRWSEGVKSSAMRCYHLGGHVVMAPFHFFHHANEGDKFELLHRYHPVEIVFSASRLHRLRQYDWVLYDCGTRLEPAKLQLKYFVREQTLHKLNKTKAYFLSVNHQNVLTQAFGEATAVKKFEYTDPKYGDTYSQSGWRTNFATEAGDCGALLLLSNVRAEPPGKIVGIHVAGRTGENEGYCVLITREAVEELWNQIARPQVLEAPVPGAVLKTLEGSRIVPQGDYTLHGVMPANKCPIQPVKTDFVKTPFYDKILDPEPKKPAHLVPFVNAEGQRVSPLAKALTKYGQQTHPFDERSLKKVKSFMSDLFESKLKDHTGKRVWTVEEAVNGLPGVKYAERINMKSSPGWPYQVINRNKAPGKWDYFDDEGKIVDPLLKYQLEDRLEKAKKLKRSASLWRDCLKDETRPVEKVDEGKTRLFTIGPLDFTLAVRMYFMDFVMAFYHMGNADFFSAVGIDPESYDWTMIYNYLREVSNNVVAGDFGCFDGTIPPEVFELICELINSWYNDGEENAKVRRVLIMEMIHTMQLVENCVYSTHQGNPSGNPLTVIINTIANFIYFCLAWIAIVMAPLQVFHENVHMKAYGDDNLVAVSGKFPEFNQQNITRFLAAYGIKYTTEDKSDKVVTFRSLDEVSFLKRGFRKDAEFGSTFVLPDMEESTLKAFFYYYRKNLDMQEQLQANMLAGLKFASFKGRKYYDSYHAKWSELMRSVNLEPISISFDEQVDVFLFGCGANGSKASDPLICKKIKRASEGMEGFMKVTNNKLVRALVGVLETPLYYACAALGIGRDSEVVEPTDDRWAVSIPSGEGKSFLCKKYPSIFVDHDELLLPVFKEQGVLSSVKNGMPWSPEIARKYDFPKEDRRILLVHHPANTNRKLIGSFITHFPTFIRTNIFQRLSQPNPHRVSRNERNLILLLMARKLEPTLFGEKFQIENATAVNLGFAT